MKIFNIADHHLGREPNAAAKSRRINALRNAIGGAASPDADVILVADDVFDSSDVASQVVEVAARGQRGPVGLPLRNGSVGL